MAQHNDYDIANQSGASLLTDLNSLLDALRSTNSGTTAPPNFDDYQMWVDTSTNILKIRLPNTTVLSICNIDTGLFFDVASSADANTLSGDDPSSTVAANKVMLRDGAGRITGNVASGYSITGDASALGNASGTPEYILNGNNLTGNMPKGADVTAGDYIVASGRYTTTGKMYFKPFRFGTYRVRGWHTTGGSGGSFDIWQLNGSGVRQGTATTVTIVAGDTFTPEEFTITSALPELEFDFANSLAGSDGVYIFLCINEFGIDSPVLNVTNLGSADTGLINIWNSVSNCPWLKNPNGGSN